MNPDHHFKKVNFLPVIQIHSLGCFAGPLRND